MDEKDKIITDLLAEIKVLKEDLARFHRMLGLNSSNSSKPPSSDGLKKPSSRLKPAPKSLRVKGKKKSGGQTGHKGSTLKQVETPDQVIHHAISTCPCCQSNLGAQSSGRTIKRQVFDMLPIVRDVTEHQAELKYCNTCSKDVHAPFPLDVTAPVQYGNRLKAFVVYLNQGQFIPEDRLQEVMLDLFSYPMSTATLVKFSNRFAADIAELDKATLKSIIHADVRHSDETSFRVGGKTWWLHLLSTTDATHYWVSAKRGDIVRDLDSGTLVHDHFKPYYAHNPNVTHGLCNAHHLRELNALIDIEKEGWAHCMKILLNVANKLPDLCFDWISRTYDGIVRRGLIYHEALGPLAPKNRGKQKRRPGHNLLIRFRNFKADVLRFRINEDVPFTNNLAERDVRMMKVKQKISGGFRTDEGAITFCRIRGFISTARKQGRNILQSIDAVLNRQTSDLFPA